MSLILDALKKLDREKAFIRKVTANIADEILKSDPVRPRKKIPLYFAGGLLTVCATAALTYVVTVNLGFLAKTAPPASTSPPGIDRHIESPPPPQEPTRGAQEGILPPLPKGQGFAESKKPSGTDSSPAPKSGFPKQADPRVEIPPSSGEPAREAPEKIPAPSAKDPNFAESRKSSPLPVEKKAGQNIGTEGAGAGSADAKKAAENRLSQSGTSPSALRLTGIVWSEDPSGRYAVINGAILTEGAEIQGIKVVEILPSRVRFMDHGRPFEIQLF
ncbi:MAG: hypothetical protein EHM27_06885 [Deltaproteobacteria bacterium]|nr:MAG: hypothetical protein EHM27_06885 [Deltaproteobacteria bacterium]